MASYGLIAQLGLSTLRSETLNKKVLADNLRATKIELSKINNYNSVSSLNQVNALLAELETSQINDFDIEKTLNKGVKDGKLILGESSKIPATAKYWSWLPLIPVTVLTIEQDRFVNLIKGANQQLRENIFEQVRLGVTLGESSDQIKRRIVGEGLPNLKDKRGVFRPSAIRAETIARTVSNSLLNKGSLMTFDEANLISPSLEIMKQWVTTSDRRTSDRCISLSNQTKPLNQPFIAADGWQGQQSPAHPNCRSRVVASSKRYRAINNQDNWVDRGGKYQTVRGLSV